MTRAIQRPGVIAFWWAYRALVGLLIATPIAAAIGGAALSYPRGDAELFDPGGVMLLEALRLGRRATGAVGWSAGSIAVVAMCLGLIPLGAAIAALDEDGRVTVRSLVSRALEHVGTLAMLWGLAAAAQAVAAIIVVILGAKLAGAMHLGSRGEDLADGVVVVVTILAVLAVGVIRDLASVAAVRGGHGFYVASSRAIGAALRASGRVAWAYGWRAGLGTAGIIGAAIAAPPVASGQLWIAAAVHQLGILGAVIARVSWLAAAMRILDDTRPRPADVVPDPPSEPAPAAENAGEPVAAQDPPAIAETPEIAEAPAIVADAPAQEQPAPIEAAVAPEEKQDPSSPRSGS